MDSCSGNSGFVVICFQLLIFVLLVTTWKTAAVYLISCDLLSTFDLCIIGNNTTIVLNFEHFVVICFQLLIFVLLVTTVYSSFKVILCCDLLSTFDLCIIGNNISNFTKEEAEVVICFQLLIFVLLVTTPASEVSAVMVLWFAFNFWSLYYW